MLVVNSRVEAGLGRESVADLVGDLAGRQRLRGSLDEDHIAGRADAEANPLGGLQVARGRAGGRVAISKVTPSQRNDNGTR
jgi:hypothetical protein